MRLCSIASGSSGNCIYVGSDTTHLLVDDGVSFRKTEEGLKDLGLKVTDLDGILITHEHSDHVKGLEILCKKYDVPIYATEGTIMCLRKNAVLAQKDDDLFRVIKADERFSIKDCVVNPIRISHDAAEPVAYRIGHGKKKVAVCTDIGYYNDYIVENLKGLNALVLEANHDVRMLQVGPYPYYLKQRILGKRGHLSNENAGKLLSSVLHDELQQIVLGHLSKENNLPELAYEAVRMEIELSECKYRADDFQIAVAKRDVPSEIISII